MITKAIRRCLDDAKRKGWDKTYWAFDIHGTLLLPTHKAGVISTEFYPYAKETMQILCQQNDIVKILFTCSYPAEIVMYVDYFKRHDIHFDYVNQNPDVCAGAYGHYESKFYFNVLFEDKAGFDPWTDWEQVWLLVKNDFSV
jgi:hypothetical protein